MAWKQLSRVEKYQNRFMTVTEEELLTDTGDRVVYGIVHKNPGVSVIPYDGTKFTMIKQYRYPVSFTGWEFPAGHMEHATLAEAARRELEEEAGLVAGKLIKLGSYYEAPGHLNQEIFIFLATQLTTGTQSLEPSEKGIEVKKFALSEINKLIKRGEIKDGLTIAAVKYLELYLQGH